jgi:HK97 family phage portal protein
MMAIVQSLGELKTIQPDWWPPKPSGVRFYDSYNREYAALYREQPNVRTCVDFLARNIAQLGLHVFRRVSETDRERLRTHGLAQTLAKPLPADMKVTRYRLIEALMGDLGVYFRAYWLKIQGENGQIGLLRLPPTAVNVAGGLIPTKYEVTIGGKKREYSPSEIVHFRGYNPENPLDGLSPLETLRRVLAEEHEAGQYRQGFWRNSARISGVIKRPKDAAAWSDPARNRFRDEWEELYSGEANSGRTAILEDGMEWQANTFNAQESEYLAGRKLTREECARAFHIPLPLVGILDHATFSNIQEQHKHLYQDSLGPWLAMIEQDIELQLLPEYDDSEGVYVEFNINEKLAGSFEEQTKAMQTAVGRPWMTANEARARQNMPSLDGDADELVTPLNVLVGGQASARDSAPPQQASGERPAGQKARGFDSAAPGLRGQHEKQWAAVLSRHYRRQEQAIVSRVPKSAKADIGGVWWDSDRWNSELTADLFKLNRLTALAFAAYMTEQLDGVEVDEGVMLAWLQEHSQIQAANINNQTQQAVAQALGEPEAAGAVRHVFEVAVTAWALSQAVTAVTAAASFGTNEAANANNLKRKTWRVNSSNPRPEHAAMKGETVGIRDLFSNGMRWPGDPAGGVENNSNCQCSVEFS